MIELIDIMDIATKLGYTDKRSIVAWCAKSKIAIFSIAKKHYLIKKEFEEVFYAPVFSYLNQQPALKHIQKGENGKMFLSTLSKKLSELCCP